MHKLNPEGLGPSSGLLGLSEREPSSPACCLAERPNQVLAGSPLSPPPPPESQQLLILAQGRKEPLRKSSPDESDQGSWILQRQGRQAALA